MTQYDAQYYIATRPNKPEIPALVPTKDSLRTQFRTRPLPPLGQPLVFTNKRAKLLEEKGLGEQLTAILFDATSIIVGPAVKETLSRVLSDGMHFYPAVYIDSKEEWHENYWYLNIYRRLDCWNRKESQYFHIEGDDSPDVESYVLSSDVLSNIDESDRLIFKMGATAMGHLFFHEKVVQALREANTDGIEFFSVSSFVEGDQYR